MANGEQALSKDTARLIGRLEAAYEQAATKSDLQGLRAELQHYATKADIETLRGEFKALRGWLVGATAVIMLAISVAAIVVRATF